jgi:zinc transport system substrate-binding protein
MKRWLAAGILSLLLIQAAGAAPLQVFVSVPPQRYLVERIGGEHVSVDVLLTPGQTPETFDPSLRQLQRLAAAQLYFLAGVPFESARLKSLPDSHPQLRIIPCCKEIAPAPGLDPHVWTSPARAGQLAGVILQALSEADPQRRGEYAANHARLAADLAALDDYARRRFVERRTGVFITEHAAWGYLARDYGLREVSLERNGREIGPRGLAELMTLARREGIRTLFVQPQQRSPLAQTLAERLSARIRELDPLAEDYLDNMHRVIDRIAEALQ